MENNLLSKSLNNDNSKNVSKPKSANFVWQTFLESHLNFLKNYHQYILDDYLEGFYALNLPQKSVISLEQLNSRLKPIGWKVINKPGTTPYEVYWQLMKNKILVIAEDIRSFEHIEYAPKPDLLHDLLGHIPLLFSKKFTNYIELFCTISNYLDTRNNNDELICLNRIFIWSVEFGLMGNIQNNKIFGAGLVSAHAESISAINGITKKLPYSIDVIHYDFELSEFQKQLFVASNIDHLIEVILSYAESMNYKKKSLLGYEISELT